jgi:hypothetical protein
VSLVASTGPSIGRSQRSSLVSVRTTFHTDNELYFGHVVVDTMSRLYTKISTELLSKYFIKIYLAFMLFPP